MTNNCKALQWSTYLSIHPPINDAVEKVPISAEGQQRMYTLQMMEHEATIA